MSPAVERYRSLLKSKGIRWRETRAPLNTFHYLKPSFVVDDIEFKTKHVVHLGRWCFQILVGNVLVVSTIDPTPELANTKDFWNRLIVEDDT